jgi:hypothetical protein
MRESHRGLQLFACRLPRVLHLVTAYKQRLVIRETVESGGELTQGSIAAVSYFRQDLADDSIDLSSIDDAALFQFLESSFSDRRAVSECLQ